MRCAYLHTPIGTLRLLSDAGQLSRIEFENQYSDDSHQEGSDDALRQGAAQLRDYFAGQRRQFQLPLAPTGTVFQHRVWREIGQIPYGEVRTYRDIARAIGKTSAARAVGAANRRNPLPIVVPCHRVIGSNGRLTGFAGGLETKALLLQLEGRLRK
ncbi:MAG: methylated-DNA--[protein]-cysteine S-methyltransferase [Halioglobus sp.]|nr:methylated-DNA--[protein]-cysteine S-methyltransferase [Halioglobus sp.]